MLVNPNYNTFLNVVEVVTGAFSIYNIIKSKDDNIPPDVKIMSIASMILSRAVIAAAVCVGFGFCATVSSVAALKVIAVTMLACLVMGFVSNERMRLLQRRKCVFV